MDLFASMTEGPGGSISFLRSLPVVARSALAEAMTTLTACYPGIGGVPLTILDRPNRPVAPSSHLTGALSTNGCERLQMPLQITFLPIWLE